MAELEAVIEKRLIEQLCTGESQWQTADAGSGRSTARHTAYDHNFHLAPSTMAAISDTLLRW